MPKRYRKVTIKAYRNQEQCKILAPFTKVAGFDRLVYSANVEPCPYFAILINAPLSEISQRRTAEPGPMALQEPDS